MENRAFTPVIVALKQKLSAIQDAEIKYQKRKNDQLDVEQTQMVASRMMHKIASQVMNRLIDNKNSAKSNIKAIEEIFQL